MNRVFLILTLTFCLSEQKLLNLQAAETAVPSKLTTMRTALTLAEAKRIAFERNWDLLAAKSDVDMATAQKIISREFPNPTLSYSTSKIQTDNHPSHTAAGNGYWDRSYDTVVAVNQLLEIGGKRAKRQASASAGFKSAEARLADARRLLDLAVTQNYIAVLLAEANVQILQQSAKSLRQEAGIAETRLKAGDISLADKSQIEIAADRLELDAQAAEAAARKARIDLEVLLGTQNPNDAWAPGDNLNSLALLPTMASQTAPGAVRPDLRAAEFNLERADADLRLQKAMRLPDPTVLVQYEHEPPEQPNTIGLGLAFPLPIWNRNRGAIGVAKAAKDQAALQALKIQGQIAGEIAAARITYENAAARQRQYTGEIQPKSEQIRKTVSFAYSKGGASLLDLLSAERNDNDVRLATAQAIADTANAAAALKAALNLSDTALNRP
ncbi:MAG: TolC family protein [Verrucomicrobia bacterium]|nr:TolC family protein [Verrucomicrobiota bacterium]